MTHVDSKIDLFTLDDLELALVLLHVDGDKLVADLGSVFRRVDQAELLLLQLVKVLGLCLAVALAPLLPADFVEAFAEEDDEGEHSPVEGVIYLLADCVEVERKDLIDMHVELLLLAKALVVACPALLLPVYLRLVITTWFGRVCRACSSPFVVAVALFVLFQGWVLCTIAGLFLTICVCCSLFRVAILGSYNSKNEMSEYHFCIEYTKADQIVFRGSCRLFMHVICCMSIGNVHNCQICDVCDVANAS